MEDAQGIAALVGAVSSERRFLAGTEGFSTEDTRAFIASLHPAGGVQVVAVDSGEIVGWCDICPHPNEGMKHAGRLGMGVRKDYRGKGVGRKLLETAVHRTLTSAVERIELEVFASNQAAIRLYESFGFALEGRKIGARKIDGSIDDVLLYAKHRQV